MNESSAQRTDETYDLDRFVQAQAQTYDRTTIYDQALAELRDGRKRSHWMWFVFPQIDGLGMSAMSRRYAIKNSAEAHVYLDHPVLGRRLMECCEAILAVEGRTASQIFGDPDDMKLRSSVTLFREVAGPDSVFGRVLDRYFGGAPDPTTLRILGQQATSRA